MRKNNPHLVRAVLGNPNTRLDIADDLSGYTGLHWASVVNNVECIKLFGNDPRCTSDVVNMKDNKLGETALMKAVRSGKLDSVRVLAQLPGTDFATKNSCGKTLLEVAIEHKHQDIMKYLIEAEICDDPKPNKPKNEKICWNCTTSPSANQKLLRCAGCLKAWYCGDMCQGEDRERHQKWCERKKKNEKRKIVRNKKTGAFYIW